MKQGTLEIINDPRIWQNLLLRSPQGTRFLDTDFLNIFSVPYKLYGYFKKGVLIAGIPIIDTREYGGGFLPQCYYQGPIFFDEIYRSADCKKIQYEIELVESILSQLSAIENKFQFCLHPSFQDIRGYSWLNYHQPEIGLCEIIPRYTAKIDLSITKDKIRANSRSARRQEEGYAKSRENLLVFSDGLFEELITLYKETFRKQSKKVTKNEINDLKNYIDYFMQHDIGYILTVRDSEGCPKAASFIFKDYNNTWHVPVVGVGETRYGGTLLYYHIIDFIKDAGGTEVDFNGANSPQRGYFKHSIGGNAQLYFEIKYRGKEDEK